MSIEFRTTENALEVSIGGYRMYYEFGKEAVVYSGVYVIHALARKPTEVELCFDRTAEGNFILKDGENSKVVEDFNFDDSALNVCICYFWEV